MGTNKSPFYCPCDASAHEPCVNVNSSLQRFEADQQQHRKSIMKCVRGPSTHEFISGHSSIIRFERFPQSVAGHFEYIYCGRNRFTVYSWISWFQVCSMAQHRIDRLQSNDVSASISCSCRCEMWNQILFFPSAVTNTHFEMPIQRLLGCRTAAVFFFEKSACRRSFHSVSKASRYVHWRPGDHHNFDVGRKSWKFSI